LSVSLLRAAIALLTKCRVQTVSAEGGFELKSPELLCICAESCLDCNQVTQAKESAMQYFQQIQNSEISADQYQIRALFVMARCEVLSSPETPPPLGTTSFPADSPVTSINGAEEIRRVLRATKYITRAVDVALTNNYKFLIYNASVIFWNVCRLAMRSGARKYLFPSLSKICDSLNEINDQDWRWRIQLNSELANSLDEAGE